MPSVKKYVYKFIFFIVGIILKPLASLHLDLKIVIKGKENIPNLSSVLIVSNHSSYLDVFIVAKTFYDRLVNIKWVISKENYLLWFLKLLYVIFPVIVVNGAVNKVKRELMNNRWVVMFPEGEERWRSPDDPKAKKKNKGAPVIALSTGVTIIPMRIFEADKVLPARSFKLNPQYTIRACIGKPFAFGITEETKINQPLLEETYRVIMNAIYNID